MVACPVQVFGQHTRRPARAIRRGNSSELEPRALDPHALAGADIGDRGINTLDDARRYIETVPLASYAKHGFGLWAVELKDDGSLVGMCGLIKRDTLDDVDIGFALLSRFEGRGYAREAANATLAYARDHLGLRRVVAITTDDNDRSGTLLERAGMNYEGPISQSGETLRLYAIAL